MNLAQLIPIVLQVSIGLMVFSLALQAKSGDLTYLLRQPSLLVRSLLAMNIVMPFVAVGIAMLFRLDPALEAALILLSVAPVPPILPGKEAKAGGNVSYAIGLLALMALLAIVFVPASVVLIARLFGRIVEVPMAAIALIVLKTVLGPLLLGALIRRLMPSLAERVARPLSLAGTLLLVLSLLPVLFKMWPAIAAAAGGFTVVAILLFTVVGLLVGHVLGGPAPEDRTVLAISTASRHPGVAMALAGMVVQDVRAVPPTIFLAVLVSAIVTAVYAKMRKRGPARPAGAPA